MMTTVLQKEATLVLQYRLQFHRIDISLQVRKCSPMLVVQQAPLGECTTLHQYWRNIACTNNNAASFFHNAP